MSIGTPSAASNTTVIAVDAMGGDSGPTAVVGGMAKSCRKNPDIRFIVHGPADVLNPLIAKWRVLEERCEVRDATDIISMSEKPSHAVRHGKGSSMWAMLETVRAGDATVAVSCGNTGALMALSMLRLRKLPGVNRPAIGILWPSLNPSGFNVMLDVGADVRADPDDLRLYAIMGASYARNGLGIDNPRVGLLNIGTEEHKGLQYLQEAAEEIAAEAEAAGSFEFVGFVEGSDIPSAKVDIIVTDGFTGNVALKTGEGTASLIRGLLKEAFSHSPLSRIGALFALTSFKRLQKRIDPRRVNGGVFLGLNGTVVKSHGSADATGVSAAIKLAFQLAQNDFTTKLATRVATKPQDSKDALEKRNMKAS